MQAPIARCARRLALLVTFAAGTARAQGAPPTASFPEPERPAPAPAPAPPPAAPPPAQAAPGPVTAPPPAAQPAPPPPAYEPAPPAYEPAPPPPPPKDGRTIPEMSVRVDPFNLLIEGKLAIELEVALLKWMSFELVPVFVVNEQPPSFGYFTGPHGIYRKSNGWGPLAGSSFDLGFWLEGKAMRGTVLKVIMTNYSYDYVAPTDSVAHVERQLFGYLGSQSRWGAFTIAGGFGLGAELNPQRHCYYNAPPNNQGLILSVPSDQCEQKVLLLRTDPKNDRVERLTLVDLNGGLGGVQFMLRISLGVVF